ncbi:MAG TPA: DUF2905 family protein [Thermoanaerobaculia bacterium]
MADPIQSPLRGLLIVSGALLLLAGLTWPLWSRWFGRLPGDVVLRRGSWTLVLPLATCLILSLLLSLLLWLFRR